MFQKFDKFIRYFEDTSLFGRIVIIAMYFFVVTFFSVLFALIGGKFFIALSAALAMSGIVGFFGILGSI